MMAVLRSGRDAFMEEVHRKITEPVLDPVLGSHSLVICGCKGGGGKSTLAAGLGLIYAEMRGELVSALCANPHMPTLRFRLVPHERKTPRPWIELTYRDGPGEGVKAQWSQLAPWVDLVGRLRVVTNDAADPALTELMQRGHYERIMYLLRHAGQLVISDMGTSAVGSVAMAALEQANSMAVCCEMDEGSLRSTVNYLALLRGQRPTDYVEDVDYSKFRGSEHQARLDELGAGAPVVVWPTAKRKRDDPHIEKRLWWLAEAAGQVVLVPYCEHLAQGGLMSLAKMSRRGTFTVLRPGGKEEQLPGGTYGAYLHIAASFAERFSYRPSSAEATA